MGRRKLIYKKAALLGQLRGVMGTEHTMIIQVSNAGTDGRFTPVLRLVICGPHFPLAITGLGGMYPKGIPSGGRG